MALPLNTETLLPRVVTAVETAGRVLAARHSTGARPRDGAALLGAMVANDDAVSGALRSALVAARPGSGWLEDDDCEVPGGEWWVVDATEGNVNHAHGRDDWGVTATLMQDGVPILAVVVLPMRRETWVGRQGGGASVNGLPLHVSRKTELRAAIVGTGQARPSEGAASHASVGRSVVAMLDAALVVRMSVPTTLELIEVAAGRMDGFWQFGQVRSGLSAGALLVREAGGTVTDMCGRPWTLDSGDFLAAAPGVHAAAVVALSGGSGPVREWNAS